MFFLIYEKLDKKPMQVRYKFVVVALIVGLGCVTPVLAQPNVVKWISRFWQRDKKPLGARSALCSVSPGLDGKYQISHDRPLFLWQNGDAIEVNLRKRGAKQLLWSLKPKVGDRLMVAPELLQPGMYQWQVVGVESEGSDRTDWKNFKVVRDEKLGQELQAFESKLPKSYSAEERALQRADFFADRELGSDVLQALFAVEKPSMEFVQERQAYLKKLCP
jgi:hypothetical protein